MKSNELLLTEAIHNVNRKNGREATKYQVLEVNETTAMVKKKLFLEKEKARLKNKKQRERDLAIEKEKAWANAKEKWQRQQQRIQEWLFNMHAHQ